MMVLLLLLVWGHGLDMCAADTQRPAATTAMHLATLHVGTVHARCSLGLAEMICSCRRGGIAAAAFWTRSLLSVENEGGVWGGRWEVCLSRLSRVCGSASQQLGPNSLLQAEPQTQSQA